METKLRLSVVIPTHKTRERTLRCLAALWLCDPQPDEVIVVDDASADNTAHSVLRKYPRHIVVRLPTRRGFAAAANHGLARASGDLLLLLDNDTEVDASAIGAVLSAFEAEEKLGVAGATLRHPKSGPLRSGGRLPSSLWCFALASGLTSLVEKSNISRWLRPLAGLRRRRVDWVSGTAMVVRRSVWEEVGPFDLGYRLHGQDIDLCVSAADAGWRIEILPDFKVLHHRGGTISGEGGSVDQFRPELMWTDLLRFAGKRWGSATARNAFLALRLGGRLRLVGRRLVSPIVPPDDRAQRRAANLAYVDALRALDRANRAQDHIQGP